MSNNFLMIYALSYNNVLFRPSFTYKLVSAFALTFI